MFVCDNRQKEEIEVRAFLVGDRAKMTPDERAMEKKLEEAGGVLEEFPGITASQSGILSLLSKLMRGSVTPVAARDVVEDWLLE